MKIAQVCPYDFSRPGGVKSHILSLSSHLSKLGHEVKVIVPNIHKELINEPNIYFFGKNRSVNIGGTKIDVNVALGSEWRELKAFLKAEQFDVIHFHTIWNPLLPFQIRYLSLKHTKHVATFHDTPKSAWIGKTVMPIMAKLIFPFLDQIISVSKSQSRFISRFSKRKISIIPNGIDLDQFQPDETVMRLENTLLFLGRLEPRKGIFYALEVFKQLKKRHPKLKLIIAGDGDERTEVLKFIAKHQLKDVWLLGFVTEEEKIRLLRQATIYLATALYGESFGIVLLEAMACGTPVVGFANTGYKNVITEEMRPYFSEPQDEEGLIKATEAILTDSNIGTQISTLGLAEVKKYNWTHVAKQIEKLYLS